MRFKLLTCLLPPLLWLGWLLLQLCRKRRIDRQSLSAGVSLLLLFYFLAAAGTGIFWVAKMELPVFDWHYLVGYVLTALTIAHVLLHQRQLVAALRRITPPTLIEPERPRFRQWLKRSALALFFASCCGGFYLLGARQGQPQILYSAAPVGAPAHALPAGGVIPSTFVNAGGRSLPLARLYHEGSSYPARTRLPGVTLKSRPARYNSFPGDVIPLREFHDPDNAPVFAACLLWREGAAAEGPTALSSEELSEILFSAQGITKTVVIGSETLDLRTAPSAGALYPVNVYLVVWHAGALEPGVYYYHPKQAALIRVRADTQAIWMLAEAAGNPGPWGNAEAALVLTTTFDRSAYKYGERAYRYVCLDAGHVGGNAAFSAAALGWRAPLIARFDDRAVNSVLGVDPAREAALLIVPLSRAADQTPERRFELDDGQEAGGSFINLIHSGTNLKRVGPRGDYPPRPTTITVPETRDLALPLPASGGHLLAALRQRRSARQYTPAPVTLDELSSLCMAAAGGRSGRSATDPLITESAELGLYVVARDVTGLKPGVYRYLSSTHSLRLIKPGDFSEACARACVRQDFCAAAAAVFVKTVRWSEMAIPDGDRGYRYAHIRAGVLGEALCLQGTALGIGTCGVGAFLDSDLSDILGLRSDEEVPLYVTAVGR